MALIRYLPAVDAANPETPNPLAGTTKAVTKGTAEKLVAAGLAEVLDFMGQPIRPVHPQLEEVQEPLPEDLADEEPVDEDLADEEPEA